MDEFVSFGSPVYWVILGVLILGRGLDFLSTWVATPNLVLEANPLAKKLGWRKGFVVNLLLSFLLAAWPFPAIVIATSSMLVAARNFQSAWLMRTLGEVVYHQWMGDCLTRTRKSLFLFCIFSQAGIYALIGVALMYFGRMMLLPFAIGMGFFTYAFAVAVYSTLSFWRFGRS
ncbi:MAG: hypothetical protein ACO1QB_03345 [Verrucomicrobiales bacterium]